MSNPFRMVQIGAGNFCRANHAPTLQRLAAGPEPPISLEAVCDLDIERAEAFCRDFGYARAYTDLDAMIREVEPDLIYCFTQPVVTASVMARLLPYGLPTFTEKPPGVTVAEAEKLAQLADQHGNISYVAFNRRRAPGIERLKRWAEEHGPVRYVRAEMLRSKRHETGFAIGTGIHPLDCLRYLCGDVAEVETLAKPYSAGRPHDFIVRLHCVSGLRADLAILVDCGCHRERYALSVPDGLMEATLGSGSSADYTRPGEVAYRGNAVAFDDPAEEDRLVAGGFMGEHLAFLDAVRTGAQPDCRLQDALESVRLSVAVQEGYSGPMADFLPTAPDPYAL